MYESLVSVVMPSYNTAGTVEESIQSVLSQSYANWELIVVDDHSADATAEIIKRTAGRDPRVRLFINERNLGAAAARNRGIHEAAGDYIAFLDSDDLWHKDKLKNQLAFMQDNGADISYTATAYIKNGIRSNYVLRAEKKLTYKNLLKGNIMSCSSVMVTRDTMRRNLFPARVFRIHEDYAAWLLIVREKGFACGLDEPLLIYRMSGNSKSSGRTASAAMNYNAYRVTGYNFFLSFLFTLRYTKHSISKRYKIKAGARDARLLRS